MQMTEWVAHAIAHLRQLDNVESVEPLRWMGSEYLVLVTPGEPTAEPGGGWAQPTEPLFLLLGREGWRVAPESGARH